jgi:hypothetical protein
MADRKFSLRKLRESRGQATTSIDNAADNLSASVADPIVSAEEDNAIAGGDIYILLLVLQRQINSLAAIVESLTEA